MIDPTINTNLLSKIEIRSTIPMDNTISPSKTFIHFFLYGIKTRKNVPRKIWDRPKKYEPKI
jgi:hypothetical protein